MATQPGEYPFVVTAAFRRSADHWQVDGSAVCIPLISSTGHGDAAIHRIHYQEGKFALANLLVALVPKNPELCLARYLWHFLSAKKDSLLVPLMQGTANVSLKERDIAGVAVDLPNVSEQRKVVERIEALQKKVEEAQSLRRETVADVYEIIRSVEREIWPDSSLTAAPMLHEVTTFLSRGRQSEQGDSTTQLIKTQHVQMGSYVPTRLFLSSEAAGKIKIDAYACPGDVLIACSAAGCLGRVARFDGDSSGNAVTDSHVAIARAKTETTLSEYLYAYLRGAQGQVQLRSRERGDWTREKINFRLTELNMADLRKVPVPLPDMSHQRKIVALLDGYYLRGTQLRTAIEQTQAELDALLPSILSQAFRNEL